MHNRSATLGALAAILFTLLALSAAPALASQAQFGAETFSTTLSTQQAGAHADQSTSFMLNKDAVGNPIGQLKDVTVTLPPGMNGNPQAIPRCPIKTWEQYQCPPNSQVGILDASFIICKGASQPLIAEALAGETTVKVANSQEFCPSEAGPSITIGSGPNAETTGIDYLEYGNVLRLSAPLEHNHPAGEAVTHVAQTIPVPLPLFNLQPLPGHVATFGAGLLFATLLVNVDVPDGGTGGLQASINYASTLLGLAGSTLTLWGVPADPSHDHFRCNALGFECNLSGGELIPFMTNPTNCTGPQLQSGLAISAYEGQTATDTATLAPLTGCEMMHVSPSLSVATDTSERDAPAGYELNLEVPQNSEPEGLATPDVKDVSVTLPAGTSLSPSMANGLQACSEAQFSADECPNASKVGTAELTTPMLAEKLTGSVFIGAPTATEKYPLRVALSAGSVTIRLFGQAQPNETTGQVTAAFTNAPQLPFSDFKLNMFGGPGAVLANPTACGAATSVSEITTYSGQIATPSSIFGIDDNDAGGLCPLSPRFAPSFSAGTTSPQAGSFSPFTMTVARADGEPSLSAFSLNLPPGLLGLLKSVPPCPEPQAALGTCAKSSEIGTATVLAGPGPLPLPVSGSVYLTGPYDGAPFGLSVVINAAAGPFNLGTAIVRSRIAIDPNDLHLTIISDPFPEIMGGIPLRVRTVNVTFNRPGFMFNPTGCSAQTITGTIAGVGGGSAAVSTPFRVAGCQSLKFAPRLTASTHAQGSVRGNGASLIVKIVNPQASGATMRGATIQMPKQLRPRLGTIQHACLSTAASATLNDCPPESLVGSATVHSSVVTSPLTGPVYLVAHGGTATPSLEMLLHGEGISVKLVAALKISSKGPITAIFESLPDVPIGGFELNLPTGPHSMLGATENVCAKKLALPYKLTDQGGAALKGSAAIAVSGCPKRSAKHTAVRRRKA